MDLDVFVSYSTKDKVVADAVVSALENENIRCWYAPRDIKPGADWGTSITEAIHDCRIILLIFSNNSNQSKRVLDEVYYAISEEKPIIPFRIENLDPTGAMRLHLSSRHWLDAYHPTWKAHINHLINSLAVNMGREATLPEEVIESPRPRRTATSPKKKPPWLWIGLAAVLIVILAAVGIVWNENRTKQLINTPAIAIAELPPTEASESEPAEQAPAEQAPMEAEPVEEATPAPTEFEQPIETLVVDEPQAVILNGYMSDDISLDLLSWDGPSVIFHENIFLSLTNYDISKGEVVPEAAENWTVSPDGMLYTFKLRTTIPWVIHTPGGETVQVTDEKGDLRFVTAQDFVDGFRRLCDPSLEPGGMQFLLSGLLKGCKEASEYEDPDNIPQVLIDSIGVRAIGDDELLIELENPSGYFLSITTSQVLSAIPGWAIDKYGSAWTNPGNMPTSGRYVIDEWVLGESVRWKRNPLLPEELAGKGNIDIIEFTLLEDEEEAYALWSENQLDYSSIPLDKLLSHRVSHARETTQVFEQLVDYFIFTDMANPPFDNVNLRSAFAAAFDRTAYINSVLEGQGLAMKHLAPPVVFGAPAIDEVGVGFDRDYAQIELASAGFPNCQGMPEVKLWLSPSRNKPEMMDIVRDWEENLNCPEGTIKVVADMNAGMDLMFMGWIADYPDEHDWVGTILSCQIENVLNRSCNEIDDLIEQAAQEVNGSKRIELYAQIEEAFFGEGGEFPLIPVRWAANYTADHTWLERTQPVMGREYYYNWTIDMDAKLAAKEQE